MGCECSKDGKSSPDEFLRGSFLTVETIPPSRNSKKTIVA